MNCTPTIVWLIAWATAFWAGWENGRYHEVKRTQGRRQDTD